MFAVAVVTRLQSVVVMRAWFCQVAMCVGLVLPSALAATPAAQPNRIRIEYVAPSDPAHQLLHEFLQEARALEKMQNIFSPFKFRAEVTIRTTGCNGEAMAYFHRALIVVCYELLDRFRENLPTETTPAGVTAKDAIIGQFFYVVAHEMGHAVIQLNVLPMLGQEEDAADHFAVYMMLQFGEDEARRLVGGTALSFRNYMENPTLTVPIEAFSSEHGAPPQRFFNLLCIAFGAHPRLFSDVRELGFLPQRRASRCWREYRKVAWAFRQLIAPHVDQELWKKVTSSDVLTGKNTWMRNEQFEQPMPRGSGAGEQ